jgi:hypothetical protein
MNEAKLFDSEFSSVMNSHIKDYSGRIAKPAFVERMIERKREKKKPQEGEVKKSIIGRSGNRFLKKDLILQETPNDKPEV